MSCRSVSPEDTNRRDSIDEMKDDGGEAKGYDGEDTRVEGGQNVEEKIESEERHEGQEEPQSRACDPVDDDGNDDEEEEEAETQRPLRDPGMPSHREVTEHNLTHIPPRPWCPHCLRGKGKDSPSLRLSGQFSESLVPRIRLDYCFLSENRNGEEAGEAEATDAQNENRQTVLVMQESECRSVWAYAVDQKGAGEEWVVHQICEDLETIGLKYDRIIKEDQELAVVDLAREIARNREGGFGTALDNSRVGDSDSNGTVERAIQDVEGQCRTMRSALEGRIKDQDEAEPRQPDNAVADQTCGVPYHKVPHSAEWANRISDDERSEVERQARGVRRGGALPHPQDQGYARQI